MNIFIAIAAGVLCGVLQFLLRLHTLKPLAQGNSPQIGKMFFSKMVIPLVLLISCALVDTALLPFAAVAFCLSSIVATVAYHLITNKKKDDL